MGELRAFHAGLEIKLPCIKHPLSFCEGSGFNRFNLIPNSKLNIELRGCSSDSYYDKCI